MQSPTSIRRLSLFLILFSLSLFLSLQACSEQKSDSKKPKAKAPNGKKLYSDYCKLCHGADGTLQASGSKNLTESTLSEKEAFEIIKNGRGQMAAFKGLMSDTEIKAVATFIQNFK